MKTNEDHVAASTSRQVPEDLRQYHFRHGYVLTACEGKQQAEVAAQALVDAGFQREELILVSHDVDVLDAGWPGEDSPEVHNPASMNRSTARFAGGANGALFGALFGVAGAYLARGYSASFGLGAASGLALGGIAGAVIGLCGYRLLGRKPAAFYDGMLSGEQVLVGVGLGSKDDSEHRLRARKTLDGLQLAVTELPQ